MYLDYQEVTNKLKVGNLYTLFRYNDFGFPSSLQFKLTEMKIEPWAQYRQSLVLIFIPKGKRKERVIRFYGENRLAIWEGFVNPNTDIFSAPVIKDEIAVQKSLDSCFSGTFMERALNSVVQKPLISII